MLEREVTELIKNKSFNILLVIGPREVGKTTILKSIFQDNINYVNLENKVLRETAQKRPKLFLEKYPCPLIIDGFQYVPELLPYILKKVDEENQKGMYYLTSSVELAIIKNIQESSAEKIGIINLNSFTFSEINKNIKFKMLFNPENLIPCDEINVNYLYEIIFKGGMPELYIKEIKRNVFFDNYINTYLTKDIKEQTKIRDLEQFKKFMISVANRNSKQLNYSNISQELEISDKTVKSWINILVTSNIIYLLEPFKSSKLKRITHMPKIIFMDTGLAAYLAGWDSARELQLSTSSGHYLETYVISEIIKSYNARGIKPNLYYYRDKDKNEIDLIIYKNNTLYPFEIKKTANPTKEMIKNFSKLNDTSKKIGTCGIICLYETLMHLDENNYIIPISSVINATKK